MDKILYIVVAIAFVAFSVAVVRRGKTLKRVVGEVSALSEDDFPRIHDDALKRLKVNFESVDFDEFNEVANFLEAEFGPRDESFVGLLCRGDFFEAWIVNLGVFVGETVRRHALMKVEWFKDQGGLWKLQRHMTTGEHVWDPFESVRKRFAGQTGVGEFLLELQMMQRLGGDTSLIK